jgi:hypothetical protein
MSGLHCAPDEVCRCGGKASCPDGDGVCERAECKSNDPCGAYACELAPTFKCRTNCSFAGHCSAGHTCLDGACVPEECSGTDFTPVCAPYRCNHGFCATTCSAYYDCGSGYRCSEARVVTPGEAAQKLCDPLCSGYECGMDLDMNCGTCPVGSFCVDHQCRI